MRSMLGVTRLTTGGIPRRQLAAEEEEEEDVDEDVDDVPEPDGVPLVAGLPSPPLELEPDEPAPSDLLPLSALAPSGLVLGVALLLLSSFLPAPDPGLP